MFVENEVIKKAFLHENIEYYGFIPLDKCRVISEKHFLNIPKSTENVIVFLLPYFIGDFKRNISLYAVCRDYHIIIKEIFSSLISTFESEYSGYSFYGCCDVSPIDEVDAASKCGLGIVGDNKMLINDKYSSFVFIAQIYTDLPASVIGNLAENYSIKECEHCGACMLACPSPLQCLSAITQKKGDLTDSEKALIKDCGYAWGCDECQLICPHSASVAISPINACKQDILPYIDYETVKSMSKEEFKKRAYAWRGRNTILRNLKLIEE